MGKSTENTDFENICDPGPNVEPAVEHLATYIKSRLQNEILTTSIAQEIEADGNKKKRRKKGSGERQWRNKGRGESVRREGVRRARLMKPRMKPVWLVSKMIINACCICLIYSRLGKTAVNSAEMTEKYLTFDVTLLSTKNKAFLLSLTKIIYILWLKYFHQCVGMELTN